jgi:hypothetical protein
MVTRKYPETSVEDRVSQHGSSGCSIARSIASAIRSLLDYLSAQVHIAIPKVNRSSDRDSVLRDDRWSPRDLDYYILT